MTNCRIFATKNISITSEFQQLPEVELKAELEGFSPGCSSTRENRGPAVPVETRPEHLVGVVRQRGRQGGEAGARGDHQLHGVQHWAGGVVLQVDGGASS